MIDIIWFYDIIIDIGKKYIVIYNFKLGINNKFQILSNLFQYSC